MQEFDPFALFLRFENWHPSEPPWVMTTWRQKALRQDAPEEANDRTSFNCAISFGSKPLVLRSGVS